MKVLVVDSHALTRQMVLHSLTSAGWGRLELFEAHSGPEALLRLSAVQPALILANFALPGMTGGQLLSALRRTGYRRPFGLVTARFDPELRGQVAAAGADFVLAKPFTSGMFRTVLAEVQARRGAPGCIRVGTRR